MSGSIRVLWNETDSAVVTIYGPTGTAATGFKVNGNAVTFPYTLSASTTFTTNHIDRYSISVTYYGTEIAATPDGERVVDLGDSDELVFAPSPDAGKVTAPANDATLTAIFNNTSSDFRAAQAAAFVAQGLAVPTPLRLPINSSWITNFQSGHGWVPYSNAPPATFVDDTNDFVLGSQSVKVVTKTDNSTSIIQKTGMTVATTGKSLRLWVKVEGILNLTELLLYLGDATLTNYYQWTILDAGGSAQQIAREGEWVPITLGFADGIPVGAPTRDAMTQMRLRARAVNGQSITVHYGGIALVPETTLYPNGVVSFTCDDTYVTQYTAMRPALDKYGWGATAYTIADKVGTSGFMTLAQLQQLEAQNGWDVAGHAFTTANHGLGFTAITPDELDSELRSLRQWLGDAAFKGQDHLAYPLGAFSPEAIAVCKSYFKSARTIIQRHGETLRPGLPMRLRSISLSNTTAVSTVTAMIDRAYANKGWLIITVHDLEATATLGTQYAIADFQSIVDYCATKGIAVQNVSEVLRTVA